MERVERIKDLNVRGFCAQGIVSADASIPICIVSCPAGESLRTAVVGSPAVQASFCRSRSCRAVSAASSSAIWNKPMRPENCTSSVIYKICPIPTISPGIWRRSTIWSGWSRPRGHSAAPAGFWTIWAAIPIGSPSPITACKRFTTGRLPSPTRTTNIRSGPRWRACRQMSS